MCEAGHVTSVFVVGDSTCDRPEEGQNLVFKLVFQKYLEHCAVLAAGVCCAPSKHLGDTCFSGWLCWESGLVGSHEVAFHMNWVISLPALTGLGQLPNMGMLF